MRKKMVLDVSLKASSIYSGDEMADDILRLQLMSLD